MRKFLFPAALAMAALLQVANALPAFGGGPAKGRPASPLDGVDLTEQLLAAAPWFGDAKLPGTWVQEATVGGAALSQLAASPKLFGYEVIQTRARHRGNILEAIEATFVDAGSYFGYFDDPLPEGLTQRKTREEIQTRTAARQATFATLYADTLAGLESAIGRTTRPAANPVKVGRSRVLRAEPREWRKGNLTIRLLAAEQRLLRVTLQPVSLTPTSWLDHSLAGESTRQRLERLAATVVHQQDGTVEIVGLQPLAQGNQPYCGLSSLGMTARHFGLQVDEAWLAAAGGFENTGSASGSKMLALYAAVAVEAGVSMSRQSKLDEAGLRRAIDAGLPVIVWRRYSKERNALHSRFMAELARSPAATLPDPNDPRERASWPGPDAPPHASVITGYHADRKEVLFLESWTGKDVPRRMRIEELAATTYLCFIFKP